MVLIILGYYSINEFKLTPLGVCLLKNRFWLSLFCILNTFMISDSEFVINNGAGIAICFILRSFMYKIHCRHTNVILLNISFEIECRIWNNKGELETSGRSFSLIWVVVLVEKLKFQFVLFHSLHVFIIRNYRTNQIFYDKVAPVNRNANYFRAHLILPWLVRDLITNL